MRRLLILIIVFHSVSLFSQNVNDMTTMIINSVRMFSSSLITPSGNVSSRYRIDYMSLEGLPMYFPVDSLPDFQFIHTNKVTSLPISQRRNFRKGVNVLFVHIELYGSDLVIRLLLKNEQTKGFRTIRICIVGSGEYKYSYSCTDDCWELKEVKCTF